MSFRVTALDHVQVAMPGGGEAEADAFYADVLGFEVLPKPEPLASRGGRWFACGDVQVHLGVEADFRPARKAQPALVIAGLDGLVAKLTEAGVGVCWDQQLPGVRRCYVNDPFGNRLELIEGRSTSQLPIRLRGRAASCQASRWRAGVRRRSRSIVLVRSVCRSSSGEAGGGVRARQRLRRSPDVVRPA